MTLFSKAILRDVEGATAIEYAVIAGLIGLGIVGSLVTTRGSLNSVFGTASSQMSVSTAAGSATQQPTFNYATKTVSLRTDHSAASQGRTDGVVTYTRRFTDGAYMSWADGSYNKAEEVIFYESGQTQYQYYGALPSQNRPEMVQIYTRPVDGKSTGTIARFGSDGTAVITTQLIQSGQVQSSSTTTGLRSDFQTILDQVAIARQLPSR